jgi:hypothetical protein
VIPIEAVQRRREVQGALDTGRIQAERERQVPERNVHKREAERQRVEGAGAETGNHEQQDQHAVAVGERKARRDDGEHSAADQEDGPRAEQRAEVHGQRSDEHRRAVERGADPRALVDADADVAPEIGEAQRQQTRGQRRHSRAHVDDEDAEHRAVRQIGRQRRCERTGGVGFHH